jgi:hypothetical protein
MTTRQPPAFLICRDDPGHATWCWNWGDGVYLAVLTRKELAELALGRCLEQGTHNLMVLPVSLDDLRERLRQDEDISGVVVDTVSSVPVYTVGRAELLGDS